MINGTQGNGQSNPQQSASGAAGSGPTPNPNSEAENALSRIFFSLIQRVLNSATENSNAGG